MTRCDPFKSRRERKPLRAARLRALAEDLARERSLTIDQARVRLTCGFGDATAAEIGEQELSR